LTIGGSENKVTIEDIDVSARSHLRLDMELLVESHTVGLLKHDEWVNDVFSVFKISDVPLLIHGLLDLSQNNDV
jgi:hypothetical protein